MFLRLQRLTAIERNDFAKLNMKLETILQEMLYEITC